MLGMLLAYDAAGEIVATLDYCMARDDDGNVVGLIDFAAHEADGGALTDIWTVSSAVGSGTWPEFIGSRAHEFRVEIANRRIVALVHRASGHRRERAEIEGAIVARRSATPDGDPVDLRDVIGGPTRPIHLDDRGRRAPRPPQGSPAHLPIHGRS